MANTKRSDLMHAIQEFIHGSLFQFMLREFETRRPQFEQLTQSAEGILSQPGDSAQDSSDLAEVRSELGSISQQWDDLTNRLTQRSNHIDQAQGTSERYQVGLVKWFLIPYTFLRGH